MGFGLWGSTNHWPCTDYIPYGVGCSRESARMGPLKRGPPCQGPRAMLGPSALVLYWRRLVGRYEICATGGKLAQLPLLKSVALTRFCRLLSFHRSSVLPSVTSRRCSDSHEGSYQICGQGREGRCVVSKKAPCALSAFTLLQRNKEGGGGSPLLLYLFKF